MAEVDRMSRWLSSQLKILDLPGLERTCVPTGNGSCKKGHNKNIRHFRFVKQEVNSRPKTKSKLPFVQWVMGSGNYGNSDSDEFDPLEILA